MGYHIPVSLPKHDRELLDDFARRYARSGTLMAGVVYEATWCIRAARDWWHELFADEHAIAWVSDPRLVDIAPAAHIVALGPSGHTVHANGRRDRHNGFTCSSDAERARTLGKAHAPLDGAGGLRPLTSKAGWNLLCGCELDRVDLLLGWVLKDGAAPPGFDVVAGPERTFFGLRLAHVTRDRGWGRVNLSPAAIKAATEQLASIPGAPRGKPKLELLAGGEVLAMGPKLAAPGEGFEPSEADLTRILRGLEEISADSFEPPLTFESLARDGDMLRLIVDGDAVSVPWGGWTKLEDVEDLLLGALRRYTSGHSS